MIDAVAINRGQACAILDDGTIVHFTSMYDSWGDETNDAADAVSAVAPLPGGKWLAIDLTCFADGSAVH